MNALESNITGMNFAPIVTSFDEPTATKIFTGTLIYCCASCCVVLCCVVMCYVVLCCISLHFTVPYCTP